MQAIARMPASAICCPKAGCRRCALPIAAQHAAAPNANQPNGIRAALLLRQRTQPAASKNTAVRHCRCEKSSSPTPTFCTGGKLRRALVMAARRGTCRYACCCKGGHEYFMQYHAARPVYGALLKAGIEIHEYEPSFLHAWWR